jgi:SAM-dependent methyltransferase
MEEARPMTGTTSVGAGDYRDVLGDSFAGRYREHRDSWTREPAMRQVVDLLLARLPADSRVLDVGTGRGCDAEALLEAGHRVDAVDLVTVAEWEPIRERWPGRVGFHTGNAVDLDFEAEFDAVLDNGCLHHQHPDDYLRYLGVLRRALRPGGLLSVSFFVLSPQAAEGFLHVEEDGRLAREFTEPEAVALIASAGCTVTAVERIPRARPDRAYLVVTASREDA